jgi:hypothetical protein
MEARSLKLPHILWIAGLGLLYVWHVGFSFAQGPNATSVISGAYIASDEAPSPSPSEARESSPIRFVSSHVGNSPWPLTIQNAKANLRPDLLPKPSAARLSVEQSANQLNQFLSGARDNRYADWLFFIRWNELQKQLSAEEPDIDALIQLEKNMRQNYFGLELQPFRQLRENLAKYISALRFGQEPQSSIELIGSRLDQLNETLQMPANGADADRQRDIGLITSILSQSNQSSGLLQSVRGQFSRPNVRVLVSRDFIQSQFSRPVAQPRPVRENILGTMIIGNSCTTGQVTPLLMNNPRQASVQLLLSAQLNSQTIGYNRKIRINSLGTANITARETVTLSDAGLSSLNDTTVHAPLQSTITSIEHRSRIVRRIASRKAAEQKPQADAIAQGRLNERSSTSFHTQLAEQISTANAKLKEASELPILGRLGLPKPKRTSWSSDQYLSVLWKQQSDDQLAAPASCPLVVQPRGLALQLHQSALINIVDPIMGGRVVRSSDLDDIAKQFGREPSEELKKEAGGEKWSIDLAGYHPIEVEFDDQLIKVRIRTTKLDRGDQALEQPATIEVAYKVELDQGAIQLRREGDVKIDFAGRAQRGLRAVTLRSFLKNKFDSVFKETLFDEPLRVTDRLPANAPKVQLVDVQVDDGWIQATLM